MRAAVPWTLALGLLVACAGTAPESAPLPEGLPALEPGARIGKVEVEIDRAAVAPNGVDALERYGIPDKVRNGVSAALGRRLAEGSGDVGLHIAIDRFRLRSGANAFWLGAMGGADIIRVTVAVQRGDTLIKTYSTDTSTVLGGIAFASPTRRSERLVQTISERIVEGL